MISFTLKFHPKSTHTVSVLVHNTRRAMRSHLTRIGHKNSADTAACCWQADKPAVDGVIAEIHLAKDHLETSHIIHECFHASWHRARILGWPIKDELKFEEWIANDTGTLADALIYALDHRKIQVRYSVDLKRRMI